MSDRKEWRQGLLRLGYKSCMLQNCWARIVSKKLNLDWRSGLWLVWFEWRWAWREFTWFTAGICEFHHEFYVHSTPSQSLTIHWSCFTNTWMHHKVRLWQMCLHVDVQSSRHAPTVAFNEHSWAFWLFQLLSNTVAVPLWLFISPKRKIPNCDLWTQCFVGVSLQKEKKEKWHKNKKQNDNSTSKGKKSAHRLVTSDATAKQSKLWLRSRNEREAGALGVISSALQQCLQTCAKSLSLEFACRFHSFS